LSKMAWLPAWAALLRDGFREFVCTSCQFNSIHKKEFRFVTYLLAAEELETKCPGGHEHVRIEGGYTKPSAVFTWELANHLASGFEEAVLALRREKAEEPKVDGFETFGSLRNAGPGSESLTSMFWRVMQA